ncbi:MAG: hypothetical protein OXI91_13755 [Chloroflexota bacterium]|nr:hypothetical protein [Chloroflexota bacterium]
MPVGPDGQIRPEDDIENAVLVAKIATGEAKEEYQEQVAASAPKRPRKPKKNK